MRRQEAPRTKGDSKRRAVKVPENNVKEDQVQNNVKDVQIQNNVKDGQREAKVHDDMMGEKRCTNEMVWKPLETRPHRRAVPAGSRRQCSAQDSAGMIGLKGKTAREGTQGPMKEKSGSTAGKEHSQQQARTGEDWLRQEDREPTDGESDTHVQ